MGKGYVACSAKFYKKGQMQGLMMHNKRQITGEEHVMAELTPDNIEHVYEQFPTLEMRMVEAQEQAKSEGRKKRVKRLTDTSNVMIDNVVILDRDLVNQLKQERPDRYREDLMDAAKKLSDAIKEEFGLEPMGIQLHLDEGHWTEPENGEEAVFNNNFHFHMQHFNFDFKTLTQPLRTMKRGDFSKFQDMAAEAFAHLGFIRGRPKEETDAEHLNKKVYLERQKALDEVAQIKREIELQREQKRAIEREISALNEQEAAKKAAMAANFNQMEVRWNNGQQKLNGLDRELANKERELASTNQKLAIANQELQKMNDAIPKMGAKFQRVEGMAQMLEARRNDFERFLQTTDTDLSANERKRLREAENLLWKHNLTPQPVEKAIDQLINDYNQFKPR